LLLQDTLPAAGGQALDVQSLAPGMYALKAMVSERVYAGRFIKQ